MRGDISLTRSNHNLHFFDEYSALFDVFELDMSVGVASGRNLYKLDIKWIAKRARHTTDLLGDIARLRDCLLAAACSDSYYAVWHGVRI
jgi:hypothetical protein